MTQTPQKQNAFAALDKKVADGIAAEKAADQAQSQAGGPAALKLDQPSPQKQTATKN